MKYIVYNKENIVYEESPTGEKEEISRSLERDHTIEYSPENLKIAEKEAYKGEYEIIEFEGSLTQPMPLLEDRIEKLEKDQKNLINQMASAYRTGVNQA